MRPFSFLQTIKYERGLSYERNFCFLSYYFFIYIYIYIYIIIITIIIIIIFISLFLLLQRLFSLFFFSFGKGERLQ